MLAQSTKDFINRNQTPLCLFALWMFRLTFLKQGNEGGVAINKFVIVQLVAELGIFVYLIQQNINFATIFILQPIRYFAWMYLLGVLSILWGIIPIVGSYFAFQNLLMLLFIYHIFSQVHDFFQLERFFLVVAHIILLLFIFEQIISSEFYFHSVGYSTVAGILFTYSIVELSHSYRPLENQLWLKRSVIFSTFILLITTSGGALVSTACSAMLLIFFAKKNSIRFLSALCAILFLFAYWLGFFDMIIEFLCPGKSIESIESAHGRTHIWSLILEKAAERPWLGWGYASVERIIDFYCIDSHNFFVGILGNLGYVGCAFGALGFLSLLGFTFIHRKMMGMSGFLVASFFSLVNSNTYNFVAGKETLASFIFQLVVVLPAMIYIHEKQKSDFSRITQAQEIKSK